MKPTKEIVGLRIISILDGTQVGTVKEVVVNPQGKSLDFVVVDQPTDIFGAKVISFNDILGIGEFALTIPEPKVIQDVIQSAEAQDLLRQDVRVLGTKVMTKKGQLIGLATELIIDEETGQIAACLFEAQGQSYQVGVEQIITLGKELLVIESQPDGWDFSVQELNDQPSPTPEMTLAAENVLPTWSQEENRVTTVEVPAVEPVAEPVVLHMPEQAVEQVAEPAVIEPVAEVIPEPAAEPRAELNEVAASEVTRPETNFNLFEQRQLQYFIGKRAEKDIVLDNGELLRAGDEITAETVARITSKTTLMEVSSHLQKN